MHQPKEPAFGLKTLGCLLLLVLLELGWSLFSWFHPPIPVLNFHDIAVSRGPRGFWTLPPDRFEAILSRVTALGFQTLDTESFLQRLGGWGGYGDSILLTFDDGYESHLSVVQPLLTAHGLRGVFFVLSGTAPAGRLKPQEILRLAGSGLEIGSHSATHGSLIRGVGELPEAFEARLDREIGETRSQLQKLTGQAIRAFAYPEGEYTAETVRAVSRAGYLLGFTTDLGYGRPWQSRLETPRNLLFRDATPESVQEYLLRPRRELKVRLALDVVVTSLLLLAIAIGIRRRRRP